MSCNDVDCAKTAWLGAEAPRYTSYPSAHHFSAQTTEATYRRWLSGIKQNDTVSLYVHIPFCREMCWFCGCHTKATRRYEPVAGYVRTLLAELALLKSALGGRGRLVNIHFGGGSPSLLAPDDLTSILDSVASTFATRTPGECAIELDPRTATPKNIAYYAELGFNRVSIGIQDFDPEVQHAINRIQSYAMVSSVMQRIGKAGIHDINCDLVYGLPHQTRERFRDTLEKTLALAPSRIALFSYAHMPQLKKHQQLINEAWLPSETDKLALYSLAHGMLTANGYVAIGIDHFARADDALAKAARRHTLKRNFQGYVTDATDVLIGIGSSAISQLPQGYAQNSAKTSDYMAMVGAGKLPTTRGWTMTDDDRLRKAIIDELMCYLRADITKIATRFGAHPSYLRDALDALGALEAMGIVRVNGDVVEVVGPYRMAARVVAAAFDPYRAAAGRYSKVA